MQFEYGIKLKVDLDDTDEETKEVMRSVVRQAAQMVHAQAVLIAVKRKPQISVTSDNFFDTTEKIELFDAESEHFGTADV